MPAKADGSCRPAAPFPLEEAPVEPLEPVEPVEPLLDVDELETVALVLAPTMSVVAVSLYMSLSGYFKQRPIDSS